MSDHRTSAKLLTRFAALIFVVALPVGALLAVIPTQAVGAATVNVTNCRESGSGSLRTAVASASSGDTIAFALSPTCRLITELGGPIAIATDLTIDGPGASTLAVSGDRKSTVFVVPPGVTATISGLTVEDGTSTQVDGGGIANGGTLTVARSIVSGNRAAYGGGISNGGTLTVAHSTVSGNTGALWGGGIYNTATLKITDITLSGNSSATGGAIGSSNGTITVTGSTFAHNSATSGGGIFGVGTVTVSGTTLSANTASAGGGGIASSGSLAVSDATFSRNTAQAGGGIFNNSGTLTVSDSTFSGNASTGGTNTGGGGGIYDNGTVTVTDSTFSGNHAADGGGGLSNAGRLTVTNSTLWENGAGKIAAGGGIYNFGARLTVRHATLSANTAPPGTGGGIYTRYGTTILVATIVAGAGAARDCSVAAGTLVDGGYNLDDDGSCRLSRAEHSLPRTPAGLAASLANNGGPTRTIALRSGSAAINQVTLASDCTVDAKQGAVSTPCDIGVVELVDELNPKVSTIASSLLSPFQAFKSVASVIVDAAIAAGAVLFIAFPSAIFNNTFRENYAEIRESWRRILRRKPRRKQRPEPEGEGRDWARRLGFAVVVLIGSLLSSLNDPHFGLHWSSLVTYLAVAGSIMIGAAVPGLVTVAYHRRRYGTAEHRLHALPAGLAIAAGCVLLSRLTGFQPGYLYGVVAGIQFARELPTHEKGHVVALTTLTTLAVAIGAWFAWVPVNDAAGRPGAFIGLVLLDDLLAALFVSGLVGCVVGLIPLRFMPGHTLKEWRREAWAAVFALSLFGLIQVMIRPHGAHPRHVPMVVTIVLFLAFGIGSLIFRDYFDRKHRRANGERVPRSGNGCATSFQPGPPRSRWRPVIRQLRRRRRGDTPGETRYVRLVADASEPDIWIGTSARGYERSADLQAAFDQAAEKLLDVDGWVDPQGRKKLVADLAVEGGGVKGIALAGAVLALDEAGYSFARVAGTSAGAIVATLIAGLTKARRPMTDLRTHLSTLEFSKFIPQGRLRHWFEHASTIAATAADAMILTRRMGLYSGDYLEEWLGPILVELGADTFDKLGITLDDDPGMSLPEDHRYRLVVHTSDITRGVLVQLPWDYKYYGLVAGTQSVAHAVRASMSIPFFFDPVTTLAAPADVDIPQPGGGTARQHYAGGTVTWVDGGLLANFPINAFRRVDDQRGRWPTIGIKLSSLPRAFSSTVACTDAITIGLKCIHTVLNEWDLHNAYQTTSARTIYVDNSGLSATNFHLTEAQQQQLFLNGVRAASRFVMDMAASGGVPHNEAEAQAPRLG